MNAPFNGNSDFVVGNPHKKKGGHPPSQKKRVHPRKSHFFKEKGRAISFDLS